MKKTIIVLMGLMMMLGLFGCGKQKYNVNVDEYGFTAKKTSFAEGEKVKVTYDMIATDTDYSFYLDCDDTELDVDYEKGAYVLTFKMPAHDVTVCVSSVNSMTMMVYEAVSVTFENQVAAGDVWIMEDTDENRKMSAWGGTIISGCAVNDAQELTFTSVSSDDKYIVRMLDEDHFFYEAAEVEIQSGQSVVIKAGEESMTAFVCIYDAEGNLINEYEMFVGKL